MDIEQKKARYINRQKADISDKLWQARNIVTGYGVLQAVYFIFALTNDTHRGYLLHKPYIPLIIVVIVGGLLSFLIFQSGKKELLLRSDLGADQNLEGAVRWARKVQLWVIGLSHGLAFFVILHCSKYNPFPL